MIMTSSTGLLVILSAVLTVKATPSNLSCYQCLVNSNIECDESDLKPCPKNKAYDTCVIEISRTNQDGFRIKRECGLRPCSFNDDMANKGLGMDNCDMDKKEFSCVSCCQEYGCNKNAATTIVTSSLSMFLPFYILCWRLFYSPRTLE